jgi:hypothetical protein
MAIGDRRLVISGRGRTLAVIPAKAGIHFDFAEPPSYVRRDPQHGFPLSPE